MMDVNSGYIGYSMSRRAAEAYEDGEMPKSKWTKKAMVAAIQSYCDEFDMLFDPDLLKGMHKDEVFERFFHESSWHHTSKFFNETDFYKLDEDAVCGSFRPMNPTEPHIRRCHRGCTDGGRLLHRTRRRSRLPPARAHLRGAVQPLRLHLR